MASNDTGLWESLETRTPYLFLVAGAFSFVAAANYGVASLFDSISFNSWVGLAVLLGRLASLLGVAGLTVAISDRSAIVGALSRVVVVVALLFTVGLVTSAILRNLGADPPLTSVLGLGTVLLSLVTYSLFGGAILRTGARTTLVGGLLLGATGALLFGLLGRAFLPIGVVGTIAELAIVLTHVGIGYQILIESPPEDQAGFTAETAAK